MTRIEKLRNKLPPDFGAAIVRNPSHRAYLSHFISSEGTLLITENTATLFVDFRYIEAAKSKACGVDVVETDRLYKQIEEILAHEKVSHMLIENETSIGTLASIKKGLGGIKLKYECSRLLSGAILELREQKDADEIAAIEQAQSITDKAFTYILGFIKAGKTEREIAAELEYCMRKNGADGFAFSTICVAGKNSSLPHGVPSDYRVQNGDFVTMDFGALKNGYCSDMTRTIAVGFASDEMKRVYDTVLRAHLAAMDKAKAGIKSGVLDKTARDIINAAGYEGCFGHSLGHSLGLQIHENPRAGKAEGTVLLPNTIMTVEPGIYLAGRFGVRIENMILIKDDGFRDLTASNRELIVLNP